jgi:hypothetical protein
MHRITDEEAQARRSRFKPPTEGEISEIKRREFEREKLKSQLKQIKPAPPLWISMHIPTERERKARLLFSEVRP